MSVGSSVISLSCQQCQEENICETQRLKKQDGTYWDLKVEPREKNYPLRALPVLQMVEGMDHFIWDLLQIKALKADSSSLPAFLVERRSWLESCHFLDRSANLDTQVS